MVSKNKFGKETLLTMAVQIATDLEMSTLKYKNPQTPFYFQF